MNYSMMDKLFNSDHTQDAMSAINKYKNKHFGHGLSFGQTHQADAATDQLDALFIGKPQKKIF